MKAKGISVGVVIGLGLALTLGFAFGTGRPSTGVGSAAGRAAIDDASTPSWWDAMDAMHDSPQMQAMHAQMPAEWQQCNAMHDQMEQWVDSGQLGPGMTGPNRSGWGSQRPGGMMGSGYGPATGTGYGWGMMGPGGMMGS